MRGFRAPSAAGRALRAVLLVGLGAAVVSSVVQGPEPVAAASRVVGPSVTAGRPVPGQPGWRDTLTVEDDLGRRLTLARPARRIVSLVPAATEILFALGAGDAVVGRTRYGVHPEAARRVPSVGEGVRPSTELVVSRNPDLVILYAGEENRSSVRELERLGLRTLAMEHDTFGDLYRAIRRLGVVTGRPGRARRLAGTMRCEISAVASVTAGAPRMGVYYDVWGDPPITVGRGSYLDSLISVAGGENVFDDLPSPSPRVSLEAIVDRDPDVIVWPRTEASASGTPPGERPGWSGVGAVVRGDVLRVDGELLHRLGPRIGRAALELAAVLHPDLAEALREAVGACRLGETGTEG